MKEVNKRNRRRQECNANQSMRVGIGRGWVGGGGRGAGLEGSGERGVLGIKYKASQSHTHESKDPNQNRRCLVICEVVVAVAGAVCGVLRFVGS